MPHILIEKSVDSQSDAAEYLTLIAKQLSEGYMMGDGWDYLESTEEDDHGPNLEDIKACADCRFAPCKKHE